MFVKINKNIGITEFRRNLSEYFKKSIKGDPLVFLEKMEWF